MRRRESRRIRRAIQQQEAEGAGTATRYPAELRRQAVGYARRRLEAGDSFKSIAGELGLRPQLLHYWHSKVTKSRFRAVTVQRATRPAASEPSCLVLVTSWGHRVEGLDVTEMAELLRALS